MLLDFCYYAQSCYKHLYIFGVNINFYFPGINVKEFNFWIIWFLLFRCSVVSGSFVTPWTVARQVPLSLGFPRQESWSGLPFPSHLPNPGIKPMPPALAGRFFTSELPGNPGSYVVICLGFKEIERLISRVVIFYIDTSNVWMVQSPQPC